MNVKQLFWLSELFEDEIVRVICELNSDVDIEEETPKGRIRISGWGDKANYMYEIEIEFGDYLIEAAETEVEQFICLFYKGKCMACFKPRPRNAKELKRELIEEEIENLKKLDYDVFKWIIEVASDLLKGEIEARV